MLENKIKDNISCSELNPSRENIIIKLSDKKINLKIKFSRAKLKFPIFLNEIKNKIKKEIKNKKLKK